VENQVICNNAPLDITFVSSLAGVKISWYFDNEGTGKTSVLGIGSGTDRIYIPRLTNNTKEPITERIKYFAFIPGQSCTGDIYSFTVTVLPTLVVDDMQNFVLDPLKIKADTIITVCEGNSVYLQVKTIDAGELIYQWYKNHVEIPGATSDVYVINSFNEAKKGLYYAVVTSKCDRVLSKTYEINTRPNLVQQRWDDVFLLITEPTENGGYIFTDFQWYEINSNGSLVKLNGENKSYLYVAGGVIGKTYIVQATQQNGEIFESCPVTGVTAPSTKVTISPNPVKSGQQITVRTEGFSQGDLSLMKIQLIDSYGRIISTTNVTGTSTAIYVPNTAGFYIVRIITSNNYKPHNYIVIVK
jgi:hypothetical protein